MSVARLEPLSICFGLFFVTASAQTPSITGRWIVSTDDLGTHLTSLLRMEQTGEKVTATSPDFQYTGTLHGRVLHLMATDPQGDTDEINATLDGGKMEGTETETDAADKTHPVTLLFTATLAPALEHPQPKTHEFSPAVFYRQVSPFNKPVLTINPEDTIHTTTVDAGGIDRNGIARSYGGNPQTGPFYITGAIPGDLLVVYIKKLTLNGDWADSDDGLDERSLNSDFAVKVKDNGKSIRWHLDQAAGTATPQAPAEHLRHYTVPLKPMLGCLSAAPSPEQAPPGHYSGGLSAIRTGLYFRAFRNGGKSPGIWRVGVSLPGLVNERIGDHALTRGMRINHSQPRITAVSWLVKPGVVHSRASGLGITSGQQDSAIAQ
jgi:amidase